MLTRMNFIGLRGRVSNLNDLLYIHGWEMEFNSISFLLFFQLIANCYQHPINKSWDDP